MKIQFHNSGGESHNFWQNYTDIMSGLMIVFLLASLGYIVTHDEEQQIKAINEAYKELSDSSKYFKYSEKYNLFECLVDVRFRPLREYSRAGLREASRIPREKIVIIPSDSDDAIFRELDKCDCTNVYLITWLHKYEELIKDVSKMDKEGKNE